MKVGIAFPAFFSAFQQVYADLEVVNINKINKYDLIIFSGGEDISPSIYHEDNKYCSTLNSDRDGIELKILDIVRKKRIKILGVCRGHQLICSYLYGSPLIQDLRIMLGYNHEHNHSLEILSRNSLINKFVYKNPEVNSLHHQGIKSCLHATSRYKGIIESTETNESITVQFHPEFMESERRDEFFNLINKWVGNETIVSDEDAVFNETIDAIGKIKKLSALEAARLYYTTTTATFEENR